MSVSRATPLILFSGMGADARVFAPQLAEFQNLIVPKWIEPQRNDSLASYAQRFARSIDPGCECIVGGASFGGFVAMEVARHLRAVGCVLIGSVRSADELPMRIRMLRCIAPARTVVPIGWFCRLTGVGVEMFGSCSAPATKTLLEQVADTDADFLRWATQAVLTWPGGSPSGLPIFQIHGTHDHVLPIARTRPDEIIQGGGHVLSLTHPREVNRFLHDCIVRCATHRI